jgi:hypothetical protein
MPKYIGPRYSELLLFVFLIGTSSQTERSDSEDVIGLVEEWPSKKDIGHMFEFIAYYVACEKS